VKKTIQKQRKLATSCNHKEPNQVALDQYSVALLCILAAYKIMDEQDLRT